MGVAPSPGAAAPGDSPLPGGPPVPRVVLLSGLGGAGRTTLAAATALALAAGAGPGTRTLLLSTEEEGVLGQVLDTPVPAGAAVAVARGLWATRTDPDGEMLALASALRERGRAFWEFTGAEPLDDDEVTPLPGAGDFALLRALRDAAHQGWDAVVVDLPPASRALRTLALPEQVRRYLDRLLPPRKRAARALHPLLAELAGVPMPADGLYAAAEASRRELTEVETILRSARTSVRLVAEPGPLAVEPLRTARATLALYGLRLDAVIANRLLPEEARDAWAAGLSGDQQSALKELGDLPVREVPHLGRAPRGTDDLTALGVHCTVPNDAGPDTAAPAPRGPRIEDRLTAEGRLYWRLPLPGARKESLSLVRRGDELLLGVGSHRRTLLLPSPLRRCRVVGAAYEGGELCVRFEPDPGLWPAPRPA